MQNASVAANPPSSPLRICSSFSQFMYGLPSTSLYETLLQEQLCSVDGSVSVLTNSLLLLQISSILKNLVGKDITRVALPVHLNEPLSFCQVCNHWYLLNSC